MDLYVNFSSILSFLCFDLIKKKIILSRIRISKYRLSFNIKIKTSIYYLILVIIILIIKNDFFKSIERIYKA
jgi:hypothetical protein